MNKDNPVGWFEIPVVDLERAEEFYTKVTGNTFERHEGHDGMEMSWFPMTEGYGAAGALVTHPKCKPAEGGSGVTIYITVSDIEEALGKVAEAGGKVVYPQMDIGEYGVIAGIEDTEGNHISLHMAKGE